MPQEPIDMYIDNLLKEANLKLPDDYKTQYAERLKEQVNRRLGIVIMENLDDAGLAEFSQLMAQEPKPDILEIQKSFAARIPDFDQKIKTALAEFGKDFITATKK